MFKNVLFFIFFFSSISYLEAQNRQIYIIDSVYLYNIVGHDFKQYIGKPLYEIMMDEYIIKGIWIHEIQEPPFVIRGISVSYDNDVNVSIYLNFKKLNIFNIDMKWDRSLLMQEEIESIIIWDKENEVLRIE